MKPSYQAQAISPILPVGDIETSVQFYAEVLGFEPVLFSNDYAIVARGEVSLHLTLAADAAVLEVCRDHMSFYLRVADIGPVWAHVSRFKDRYKIHELFDRDYGMREFHVIDPDGCLIFVGQRITEAGAET